VYSTYLSNTLSSTQAIAVIIAKQYFFALVKQYNRVGVYLGVFFVLLFVGIMQKLLNTHLFTLYSLLQRILPASKSRVLFSLALLFSGLAFPAAAEDSGFYKDFVILTRSANGNNPNTTYFYTYGGSPGFTSSGSLGSFDRGNGQLLLGGEGNIFNTNGDVTQNVSLLYRVYRQGTNPGNFSSLPLTFSVKGEGGNNNTKWVNTTTNPNLLSGASGAGTYVLEVFFQATVAYNNNGYTGTYPIYDSAGGNNYRATFEVTGNVPTIWNNTQNDGNWFNSANWNNGVPNSTTDAVISYVERGTYPKIDNANNSANMVAAVRTLRIEGNGTQTGAILSLNGLELDVYGDFIDTYSGFTHSGGKLVFAGNDQSFDGGISPFIRDLTINGGGTKAFARNVVIVSGSTLSFVKGKINTNSTNNFSVLLQDGARVVGETEDSYIEGIVTSTNTLTEGNSAKFGDIGLELFARIGSPGSTVVTRRTNRIYTGVGTSTSVRRSFAINPNSNLPDVQNYDITFHYLNNELNGIPTDNLLLFRSVTGSAPFTGLGKSNNDAGGKTLTRTNITGTLNATFTLGDRVNPLPVTLVSFTATSTAQGAALLRWATATETNNKGFGIERQLTSEAAWQSVGYLASGNNTTGGTYEYTDKSLINAAFSPQAYYRLRQEDQDGKVSYSPVAVVSRSAVAASSDILLSPVPVTGSNISLTFAEAGQAGSEITITNTQGQRLFSQTTQASANAALSLPVERLAAGVYIVSVRVPGQAVRHARFVKL
jgi:hypothetical protein